jgi:hypothetical protein
MRKILLSFLSAVCMMAWGGQAAWAETEQIDGTNYGSGATNPSTVVSVSGQSGDISSNSAMTLNNKNCIKIKAESYETSKGLITISALNNNIITGIEIIAMSKHNSNTYNLEGVYTDNSTSNLLASTVTLPATGKVSGTNAEGAAKINITNIYATQSIKLVLSTYNKEIMLALNVTYNEFGATINESVGASTLCVPKAVSIPEGITAYTGSLSEDNTTLTLSTISGTIPANQPVILEGEAGTYSFPFATADAATKVGSLEGNATAAAVTPSVENATICVLDKVNDNLGFYKWTGEIPAYKAYLPVPTAASAPAIRVVYGDEPGNVTAIESIAAEAGESAPIYTLSGRQVKGQVAPGLYIKGGKKILVK